VPELKFSLAKILSFLLKYKKSPEEAIDNVEQLNSKPIRAESKSPRVSEDANPEDALPGMARANGPLSYYPLTTASTKMVYCDPLPASPPESLVVAWGDNQATEMADAIAAMKMVPTLSSHFSSSRTLLGNPPPTPSPCPHFPTKSSSQIAAEFA
jgi:hypothetical protein